MIKLEAYLYPTGVDLGFLLGVSRVGVTALGKPVVVNPLTLGTTALGVGRLAGAPGREWRDVSEGLTGIRITRGLSRRAVVLTAKVGTATCTFKAAGNPNATPGLTRGTPVRIVDADLGVLYTGRLDLVTLTPTKGGPTWATWQIVDAVQDYTDAAPLAGVGALGDTAAIRAGQIVSGIAIIDRPDAVPVTLTRASLTATPAKHLDILAASTGGLWWIRPDNTPAYCPAHITAPVVTLTDAGDPSYYEASARWWGAGRCNILTLKNHTETAGADTITEQTFTDATSVAQQGPADLTLETTIQPAQIAPVASYYLARGTGRSLTVDQLTVKRPAQLLDVADPVDVVLTGDRYPALLIGLSYSITPAPNDKTAEAWTTTYDLTGRPTT